MLNIAPGTIVDSRYEIVELIGEGGNGVVFKTKEIGTERLVALKVLQLGLVSDKESLDRFKREGSVLSQLDHPNILRCFRFGVWNERFPYIAMEYVNGIQLNDAEAVLPQQVVHIGKQICRAMEYAHKANIVHRDLKPANIMIIPDENDLVKVVDFGLARVLSAAPDGQQLTQTGMLVGSIFYMSPEQCLGRRADCSSDIYSLGCILYQLVKGEPPFCADTPVGLMHMHTSEAPSPLVDVAPMIGLNAVILHALEKSPTDRYQSMGEFWEALDVVERGGGAELKPPARVSPSRPSRVMLLLVLLALSLFGLSIAICVRRSGNQEDTENQVEVSREYIQGLREEIVNASKIEAWLKRFGKSDRRGTALAHYHLSRLQGHESSTNAALADAELSQLMKDKVETQRRLPSAYSKTSLFACLMAVRSRRAGEPGLYNCFAEFGSCLPAFSKSEYARLIALRLRDTGYYALEEKVWRSFAQPDFFQRVMLSCCRLRQNEEVSAIPCPTELQGQCDEDATKALIELKQFHSAEQLLENSTVRFGLEPSMVGYCLTSQKFYEQAHKRLLRDWQQLDTRPATGPSNLEHRFDERLQRAYILAALVHNCAQQNVPIPQCVNILIEEIKDDPVTVIALVFLCGKDNPSLCERLGRRITDVVMSKREEGTFSTCSKRRLLLVRAMNSINRPSITLSLLRSQCACRQSLGLNPDYEFAELARSLRLLGQYKEARKLLDSVIPGYRQVGDASGMLGFLLCEKAATLVGEHNIIEAMQVVDESVKVLQAPIPVYKKVPLYDELSELCLAAGKREEAAQLSAVSERLLPRTCRLPWRNWADLDAVAGLL